MAMSIYTQYLFLTVASGGRLEEKTKLNRKLVTLMLGLGFTETNNNYLTNERMNFKAMLIEEKPHVQIKGAKTENITMMRTLAFCLHCLMFLAPLRMRACHKRFSSLTWFST